MNEARWRQRAEREERHGATLANGALRMHRPMLDLGTCIEVSALLDYTNPVVSRLVHEVAPVLVVAHNDYQLKRFIRAFRFNPADVRRLRSYRDFEGYQDRTLYLLDDWSRSLDYDGIQAYRRWRGPVLSVPDKVFFE